MDGPGAAFLQHQVSHYTRRNRHPEKIAMTRDAVTADRPRVLSFGCSTGDECLDIRDHWSAAEIFGTDISAAIIAKARKRPSAKGITFFEATAEQIGRHGPYHAIFAFNVLTRFPDVRAADAIDQVYPFSMFDSAVRFIVANLAPGGVLTVHNTAYFVEDSTVSDQLDPIGSFWNTGFPLRARPDGQKVATWINTYQGREYTAHEWRALGLPPETERDVRFEWIDKAYAGRDVTVCSWRRR